MMDLKKFNQLAKQKMGANSRLVKKLKKNPPKNLDEVVHTLHDQAFEKIDCLECANCCKTTSPFFLQKDMDRIARHLRMKTAEFIHKYLEMDEDGDFVLKQTPCPFLDEENYCAIYEVRPKACREYPHTNRRKFRQILDLSLKNASICPAVLQIFEGLEEKFG